MPGEKGHPQGRRRATSGEEVLVRRAELRDAEVLLSLIDELADYERLDRPDAAARARLVEDGFGPEPRFSVLIAEIDGEPRGYAVSFATYSTFLALPTLYLEDIFVRPAARGRGVGTAIFRHLARQALDEGYGRLEWMVLDWNRSAIDFYESIGARRLVEWLPYRLTRDDLAGFLREEG